MEKLIERADALLRRTPALTLTSIDNEGYPRPVAMSILFGETIRDIWFATPADSLKVEHYRRSPKGGATFYADGENVTLTGEVEIVTDRELKHKYWNDHIEQFYPGGPDNEAIVLLRFTARRAVVVFDGVLNRIDLV